MKNIIRVGILSCVLGFAVTAQACVTTEDCKISQCATQSDLVAAAFRALLELPGYGLCIDAWAGFQECLALSAQHPAAPFQPPPKFYDTSTLDTMQASFTALNNLKASIDSLSKIISADQRDYKYLTKRKPKSLPWKKNSAKLAKTITLLTKQLKTKNAALPAAQQAYSSAVDTARQTFSVSCPVF